MADDANESIPTSTETAQVSLGPVFPPDPDSMPIGRCYPEQLAAMNAVKALRAAQQRLRETVSAFGDCRAKAAADAGDYAAANNTSFEDAVEAAMLKIAVNASIIEDIVKQACSDCSEDSE